MRVRAEPQVRLQRPILQIVQRFPPGPREIGNLITRYSHRTEAFYGGLIQDRDRILTWGFGSPVTHASEQHLLTETRIFVDFQHVHRYMRWADVLHPIERLMPARFRLSGETRDQINIEICQSDFAQEIDLFGHDGRRVLAARPADLGFHKRLHSETDTIDTGIHPSLRPIPGDGSWGSLDGSLAPWASWNDFQQALERRWFHQAGSTAAQVNGLRSPFPSVREDLLAQRLQILRRQAARQHVRGKVAVRALLRAEGIRKIDSRHSLDCSGRGYGRARQRCESRSRLGFGSLAPRFGKRQEPAPLSKTRACAG